jgi:hypothetical protein
MNLLREIFEDDEEGILQNINQTKKAEENEEMKEDKQEKNYLESINEYFKMRKKYNDTIYKMKKNIHNNETSKKKARKEKMKLKPACIKCKRPVGTIFSFKNNRYVAICGDDKTPCSLNIEIYNGKSNDIYYMIDIFKEDIDNLKDDIIRQKMDTLFNYVTEDKSIELFKKQMKLYNEDSVIYKEIVDKYKTLFDNKHLQNRISQKNEEIFRLIEKSKGFLEEYNKTQNKEFLKLSLEIQIKEIIPETENLRRLKHEVMEIIEETKNYNSTYTLFKHPVLLSKIDYNMGEQQRVIKFNK